MYMAPPGDFAGADDITNLAKESEPNVNSNPVLIITSFHIYKVAKGPSDCHVDFAISRIRARKLCTSQRKP